MHRCEAWVDGSYYPDKHRYGFGCVFIESEKDLITQYGGSHNYKPVTVHRNITGELLGAVYAVLKAIENGYEEILIVYDCKGIEMWATGEWKRNYPLTKDYHNFMKKASKFITIRFHHVKSHTGIYYNEMVDKIAKDAIQYKFPMPKFDLDLVMKGESKSLPTLVSSFFFIIYITLLM